MVTLSVAAWRYWSNAVTWKTSVLLLLGEVNVTSLAAPPLVSVTPGPEVCTHRKLSALPSGSEPLADSVTFVPKSTLRFVPASTVGALSLP